MMDVSILSNVITAVITATGVFGAGYLMYKRVGAQAREATFRDRNQTTAQSEIAMRQDLIDEKRDLQARLSALESENFKLKEDILDLRLRHDQFKIRKTGNLDTSFLDNTDSQARISSSDARMLAEQAVVVRKYGYDHAFSDDSEDSAGSDSE